MPKRLTQEEFEKRVLEKLGCEYEPLGEYVNKNTNVLMFHYKCGNAFYKRPHDIFQKGSGCPYCNGSKYKTYNEQWVIDNTPKPYSYISGYKGIATKCLFHCDKCNTDFLQYPSRLIKEGIYGCKCSRTKKKSHKDFLQELGENCLQEYEILDTYINTDTKIRIKHIPCGTVFEITPERFLHRYYKKYCPICYYKKSKGEIKITSFLEKNKIKYYKEFNFLQLPKKKFDFYLPEYNMCIEYDGQQHFKPISFFGGEAAFQETQRRDLDKNLFCINNNILLIRIPYLDINNIEQILNDILIEESSTTIEKYLVTK